MSSINDLRQKIEPKFANRDDFYAYVADHPSCKISFEQAYQDIEDNLLPIFKTAKELCEDLSGDKNYFQNGHMKHLFHMALVSRMIRNINTESGTFEEKMTSLRLSDPHYGGMVYIKDGKKIKEETPFEKKSDNGFKSVILKAGIGFSTYDDQYTTRYFGAFCEDVSSILNERQVASVFGKFLNWQVAKDSAVLYVATIPFVEKEMAQMAKANGVDYSKRFDFYQDAEKNIRAKINAFCDKKQETFLQQAQKVHGGIPNAK